MKIGKRMPLHHLHTKKLRLSLRSSAHKQKSIPQNLYPNVYGEPQHKSSSKTIRKNSSEPTQAFKHSNQGSQRSTGPVEEVQGELSRHLEGESVSQ